MCSSDLFHDLGPKVVNQVMVRHLARAVEQGELDVQAVGLSPAAALFVGLLRGEGHLECIAYPQAQPSGARLAQWAEQAVAVFLRAFGRGSGTPG